jgi:hypothetical protein
MTLRSSALRALRHAAAGIHEGVAPAFAAALAGQAHGGDETDGVNVAPQCGRSARGRSGSLLMRGLWRRAKTAAMCSRNAVKCSPHGAKRNAGTTDQNTVSPRISLRSIRAALAMEAGEDGNVPASNLVSRAQCNARTARGALQTRDPGILAIRRMAVAARRSCGPRIGGAPFRCAARCAASGARCSELVARMERGGIRGPNAMPPGFRFAPSGLRCYCNGTGPQLEKKK